LREMMVISKGQVDSQYLQGLNDNQIENLRQFNPKQADTLGGLNGLISILGQIDEKKDQKRLLGLNEKAARLTQQIGEEKAKFDEQQDLAKTAAEKIKSKDWPEAEDLFKRLKEMDPENASFWRGLAFAVENQLTREEEAIPLYQEAIEHQPNAVEARYDLARLLQRLDKPDAAREEAQKALKLHPDARFHALMGSILADKADFSAALTAFDFAARLNPQDAAIRAERTAFAQEATLHFKNLVERNASDAANRRYLGMAQLAQGRYAEAETTLREAVRLDPQSDAAHHHLSRALAGQNKYEEAVSEAREAVRLNPSKILNHYLLARSLRENGAYEEAWKVLEAALKSPRTVLEGRLLRSEISPLSRESVPLLEKQLTANPADMASRLRLATCLKTLGRTSEGAAVLKEAIKREPKEAGWHFALGTLLQEDDIKQARECFQKAVDGDRKNAEYRAKYAKACLDTEDYKKAQSEAEEALKLKPDASEYLFLLGRIQYRRNDLRRSTETFRVLAKREPDNTMHLRWLAANLWVQAEREKSKEKRETLLTEATQALRTHLAQRPLDGVAHIWLARCLNLHGWSQEAKAAARQAARLGEENDDVFAILDGK